MFNYCVSNMFYVLCYICTFCLTVPMTSDLLSESSLGHIYTISLNRVFKDTFVFIVNYI